MNPIIKFYLGGTDDCGRTLLEILDWEDDKLEACHDYIQWVFPTTEKSAFNLEAPLLDKETIDLWRKSHALKNLLKESAIRYREFLENNKNIWVCPFDHNHLRITRMLKCLMILGLEDLAMEQFLFVKQIADQSDIHPSSVAFWKDATYGTLYNAHRS